MFLCTTTNSALTTALVATVKSAITTVIGMYTFGGVVPTVAFVTGQTLNFLGGCLYSYSKLKERRRQKEQSAVMKSDLESGLVGPKS